MKKYYDLQLISQFLEEEEYFCHFQEFLDGKDIEPSEAELIIDTLKLIVDDLKKDVMKTKVETDDLPSVAEVKEWMGSRKEFREWMLLNFPEDFSKDNLVYTRDIIDVVKKKLKGGN